MRLRTALNDYKRDRRGGGTAATTTGALSGRGDRLVHVDPRGQVRDYSYALSGLSGLDRSRFGVETAEETLWFDELETVRQHYYRETALVETEYDAGEFTIHQYDLTLGRAHVTHVELRGAVPPESHLVAFMTLAPEGQETRVGRLIHHERGPDDGHVLEVFHRTEHDYVTASTGLDDVRGQIPERFDRILGDEPVEFPSAAALNRYEDAHLSGDVVVTAPLERAGRGRRTTLVTQLSDHSEIDRETAIADLCECATGITSADEVRTTAVERTEISVPDDAPRERSVRGDLRALNLLRAPSGARIAAPEFDPFFVNSGGYGYTWFRDDARIAQLLLESRTSLGLDVAGDLLESARFYCETQLDDGTWPHRVWAFDGSIAPGWANARVEGNDDSLEHQADQTATTVRFLAALLADREEGLSRDDEAAIRDAIASGLDALEESIDDDGLPEPCQNIWEDALGQFTHTAATYIEAFAAVARAPVSTSRRERALAATETAVEGLDALWDAESETYALRRTEEKLDARLDAATFALVDAFEAYAALDETDLSARHLDRLEAHVGACLDHLYRNPAGEPVAGLIRYEGDDWRTEDGQPPKIWSLTTAMGATAAAKLGGLLEAHGRDGEAFLGRAGDLYELIGNRGPLSTAMGYLPEQVHDDGRPDSGTPLGFAHGYRLRTTALLADAGALPRTASETTSPPERPRWTTGEKYGLGTVADHGGEEPSRVWFTLTEGALTEVRFPRVDLMNLRTLDFIVVCEDDEYTARTHAEQPDAEGDTFERRVEPTADDALLFRHVIREPDGGHGHEWELIVEYAADPDHDAVVADVEFEATDGNEYALYAVADTALTNTGTTDRGMRLGRPGSHYLVARDREAYTGDAPEPMLTDEEGNSYSVAAAMTTESRFDWATVGVAGSDELDELFASGTRPETRETIDEANIVLVGRLATGRRASETLALGFARQADVAAALGEAAGALADGFGSLRERYAASWREFLADKPLPDAVAGETALADQYRTALMTLRAVEDKTFLGASIASPSVPWGETVPAEESRGYGYNFVWARDLYQVFTAVDLVGDMETAVDQLEYIYRYQQDEDGFIPQNTYLNGTTRWGGEQMDNISFPAVMAYRLWERGIAFEDVAYEYEHVRRSADYVVRNGPATGQERWEEEAGYSPSSIAAEIAGLVCAGKLAIETGHEDDALVWLAVADRWRNRVDEWTATTTGTDRHTRTPYYVRVARNGDPDAGHRRTLANGGPQLDERDIIDAGFLELTRLGIKPPDEEVVRNSVAEVDDTIRVDLPAGAAFYRYNGDGYGERDNGDLGAPWSADRGGKGRLWPLLTGERGEYELLADATDDPNLAPAALLRTMQRFANSGRMIPEQVWDREYGTDYDWEYGKGTGSATPLAWSMAQYVRLAHGIDAGEPVERPTVVRERYLDRRSHEPDASPALRVDTSFRGNEVLVSGETTGELVAISTPTDGAVVVPSEGSFEETVRIEPGENDLVVAAASDRDLERAGTTMTRFTV